MQDFTKPLTEKQALQLDALSPYFHVVATRDHEFDGQKIEKGRVGDISIGYADFESVPPRFAVYVDWRGQAGSAASVVKYDADSFPQNLRIRRNPLLQRLQERNKKAALARFDDIEKRFLKQQQAAELARVRQMRVQRAEQKQKESLGLVNAPKPQKGKGKDRGGFER